MMNSVSSSNFTLSAALLEDEENDLCSNFSEVYIIIGCFTLAVGGFLIYYFVI
jgi:hypothetical protein